MEASALLVERDQRKRINEEQQEKQSELKRSRSKGQMNLKTVQLSGCVMNTFTISGGNDEGVTPVPIPNTEVKPFSAESTWLETAR